jgi:hypothetical protein
MDIFDDRKDWPSISGLHEELRQQPDRASVHLLWRQARQGMIRRFDIQEVAQQRQMIGGVVIGGQQPFLHLGQLVDRGLLARDTDRPHELLDDGKQGRVLMQRRALVSQDLGTPSNELASRLDQP